MSVDPLCPPFVPTAPATLLCTCTHIPRLANLSIFQTHSTTDTYGRLPQSLSHLWGRSSSRTVERCYPSTASPSVSTSNPARSPLSHYYILPAITHSDQQVTAIGATTARHPCCPSLITAVISASTPHNLGDFTTITTKYPGPASVSHRRTRSRYSAWRAWGRSTNKPTNISPSLRSIRGARPAPKGSFPP